MRFLMRQAEFGLYYRNFFTHAPEFASLVFFARSATAYEQRGIASRNLFSSGARKLLSIGIRLRLHASPDVAFLTKSKHRY